MLTGEKYLIFYAELITNLFSSRFVPYQGLQLVDHVKGGKVVDFAVFNNRAIGDELMIYVLEEGGERKMYKLVTKDAVPHLSLTYGRYAEFY